LTPRLMAAPMPRFFPDLPADQWDIEIEAEIAATDDVPASR
jgi:hypothetical protein